MPDPGTAATPLRTARRLLQVGALGVVLAVVAGDAFELDRYHVPKELVLQLASFGAAGAAWRAAERPRLSLGDGALLLWLVLGVLSALAASNGWLAIRALGVSAAGLACYWTARAVAARGLERPLLVSLAAATAIGAATGILQAYGLPLPFEAERRAPGGMLGNRNFMAHLAAIGLPLLLYLVLTARHRLTMLLGTVAMAVSSVALVLSRSRAAWLAVAAAVTFLLVEGVWLSGLGRDARVRARLGMLAASAALGVVLAVALPNTLAWRSDSPYMESLSRLAEFREGSGRGRLIQWRNSLDMASDHVALGVGPGNWAVEYPRHTTPDDPSFAWGDAIPTNPWPSSDWVALLAERGLPSFVLLAATLAALAVVGWRRSRRHGASGEGLAGLAMVALIIVTVVAGLFDAVLLLAAPTLVFWTALGALQPAPRAPIPLPDELRPAVRWALLAVAALVISRGVMETGAIMLAGSGEHRARLSAAAALDPGNHRLHLMLAGVGERRRVPCRTARPHLEAAMQLVPHHPMVLGAARRCGVRPVVSRGG